MIDSQHFLYFAKKIFLVSLLFIVSDLGLFFTNNNRNRSTQAYIFFVFLLFLRCCAHVHVQLEFANPIHYFTLDFPYALCVVDLLGIVCMYSSSFNWLICKNYEKKCLALMLLFRLLLTGGCIVSLFSVDCVFCDFDFDDSVSTGQ